MKIPEDEFHQTELIWDDLVHNQLQFASKNQLKDTDETLIKPVKQQPAVDSIFDIMAKSK